MDAKTYCMDSGCTTLKQKYKIPCHRAWNDIVIPQLVYRSLYKDKVFNISRLPLREYDSTFSGSYWGERKPLVQMYQNEELSYEVNRTDKFRYPIELEGDPDLSLVYRGYFMYNPCGYACWSQVIYIIIICIVVTHWYSIYYSVYMSQSFTILFL